MKERKRRQEGLEGCGSWSDRSRWGGERDFLVSVLFQNCAWSDGFAQAAPSTGKGDACG